MLRNFVIALFLVLVVAIGVKASPASALTASDVQAQIQALLAQIANLTNQINILRGQVSTDTTVTSNAPMPFRICTLVNRNLAQGAQGDDVHAMQEFLQGQGYLQVQPTGYFGPLTAAAVAKWQSSQGVSAVGAFGPQSRARLQNWCGNPTPTPLPNPGTCKPVTYMAIACSDGSQAQPQHNESGCLIGYECPVANFTPPSSCKAWNDGCNVCSRASADAPIMCTLRACFAAGKGYCSVYFGGANTSGNLPPVISAFSGPTTLAEDVTGTWSVQANDPEGGTLSYSVIWGDENIYQPYAMTAAQDRSFVQTTTFTHAYANPGTYTVLMTVRDSSGQQAQTSSTVQVGSAVACTLEYAPVCGQPPEPACRHSIPACMIMTQGPQTYGNRCQMNAAGASYLYDGQCAGTINN